MRRRSVKWILILALGLIAIYTAYELHFKYVINDYQVSLIEKRMVKNYKKHSQELTELVTMAQPLQNFELIIAPDGQMDMTLDNTGAGNHHEAFTILIEGDSTILSDIPLQWKDVERLISDSTLFDTLKVPHWMINYKGSINSAFALTLLSNWGIDKAKLNLIREKLQKTHCLGLAKRDDEIQIRYKGHAFESFNYVYVEDPIDHSDINKLSGHFYWQHNVSDLFCGWTNWGWI